MHQSTRFPYIPSSSKNKIECDCMINFNGSCHRDSMKNYIELMKKSDLDMYITNCPYHKGYYKVSLKALPVEMRAFKN